MFYHFSIHCYFFEEHKVMYFEEFLSVYYVMHHSYLSCIVTCMCIA